MRSEEIAAGQDGKHGVTQSYSHAWILVCVFGIPHIVRGCSELVLSIHMLKITNHPEVLCTIAEVALLLEIATLAMCSASKDQSMDQIMFCTLI